MSEVVENSSARKRAMLRQMGVDVWLDRTGHSEPLAELSEPEVSQREDLPSERTDQTPLPGEPARSPPRAEIPAPQESTAPKEPIAPKRQPSGPALAPFSVACLSKGPVLMLVELAPSKAGRRFALDVLAAASGVFGGETTQLAFDWPQPGVDNTPETVRKALGAFVAKQIGDLDPARLLMDREVAGRLERVPDGCVLLAPLAELMVDGQKKRALWTELEGQQ
jgi:hypothetical protein